MKQPPPAMPKLKLMEWVALSWVACADDCETFVLKELVCTQASVSTVTFHRLMKKLFKEGYVQKSREYNEEGVLQPATFRITKSGKEAWDEFTNFCIEHMKLIRHEPLEKENP